MLSTSCLSPVDTVLCAQVRGRDRRALVEPGPRYPDQAVALRLSGYPVLQGNVLQSLFRPLFRPAEGHHLRSRRFFRVRERRRQLLENLRSSHERLHGAANTGVFTTARRRQASRSPLQGVFNPTGCPVLVPAFDRCKQDLGTDPGTGLKIAYNPNGYVPDNLIYGVGFTYSF